MNGDFPTDLLHATFEFVELADLSAAAQVCHDWYDAIESFCTHAELSFDGRAPDLVAIDPRSPLLRRIAALDVDSQSDTHVCEETMTIRPMRFILHTMPGLTECSLSLDVGAPPFALGAKRFAALRSFHASFHLSRETSLTILALQHFSPRSPVTFAANQVMESLEPWMEWIAYMCPHLTHLSVDMAYALSMVSNGSAAELVAVKPTVLAPLVACQQLEHLTWIMHHTHPHRHQSEARWPDTSLAVLTRMRSLRHLSLHEGRMASSTEIEWITQSSLASQLYSLDLSKTGVTPEIGHFLGRLHAIRELHLNLTSLDAIQCIASMPHLECLHLEYIMLLLASTPKQVDTCIQALAGCTQLVEFYAEDMPLTADHWLRVTQQWSRLQTLALVRQSLASLQFLTHLPHLDRLVLSQCTSLQASDLTAFICPLRHLDAFVLDQTLALDEETEAQWTDPRSALRSQRMPQLRVFVYQAPLYVRMHGHRVLVR
jgi:hypothetical protein